MSLYQELLSIQTASQLIVDRCEKAIKKLDKPERTKKDFAKVFEKRKKMRARQDRKFLNKKIV